MNVVTGLHKQAVLDTVFSKRRQLSCFEKNRLQSVTCFSTAKARLLPRRPAGHTAFVRNFTLQQKVRHCYSGKTEESWKATLRLIPSRNCASYYWCKFIVFEIFGEKFQFRSEAVGIIRKVSETISVCFSAHANIPLYHGFAVWVSRAGGPGHSLQHQLSPGVLCPGWGISASPVLSLLMLFGLVFNDFFFMMWPTGWIFSEGK